MNESTMDTSGMSPSEPGNARPRPRMRRHAAQAPAELYEQYMADVDTAPPAAASLPAGPLVVAEVPAAQPDAGDEVSEELETEYEHETVEDVVAAMNAQDDDDLDYEPGEFESAYAAAVVIAPAQQGALDAESEANERAGAEPIAAAVALPVQGRAADAADAAPDGWIDAEADAPRSRRGVWTKVQFGLAALSATPLLFIGGLGGWPWQEEKVAVAGESPLPANYPVSVELTRLGINAPTDALGVDPLTKVLQPPAIGRAGWYEAGPEPGELGRAVMLGRRSPDGVDVFAKLDQVRSGDRIIVRTVDGSELTFLVTEVRTFDADEVPIARIYGGSQRSAQLRLISSAGEFVAGKGGYQRNVVVFANFKN
ncbi:MAG: class F sortase [Sporichthyaceae bacterium]